MTGVMDSLEYVLLKSDPTKAALLERMLKDSTTSYKYYWLQGVIDEACRGCKTVTFSRLVAMMVAQAWYPVVTFRLSLGMSDKLGDLIFYVREHCDVPKNASADEIVAVVERGIAEDKTIAKKAKLLTRYVPYRVIRPFYEEELSDEMAFLRSQGITNFSTRADKMIFTIMQSDPDRGLYSIVEDDRGEKAIVLSDEWAQFIRDNQPVLQGWLDSKLIRYLQSRNPSVPAISLKLHAPRQRDLRIASKFWYDALEGQSFRDIYTRQMLVPEVAEQMGGFGIDHFVPWSFVMHDESWNLIPTFGSINSSKSDRLPPLDAYLRPFCELQFDAIMSIKQRGRYGKHRHFLDCYRQIDPHFDAYENGETSREAFCSVVSNTVIPLYQIAWNQGYGRWECGE